MSTATASWLKVENSLRLVGRSRRNSQTYFDLKVIICDLRNSEIEGSMKLKG